MPEPTVAEWVRSDDPQPHPALIDAGVSGHMQRLGYGLTLWQTQVFRAQMREYIERERVLNTGLALGLTRAEAMQAITRYRASGWGWSAVRDVLFRAALRTFPPPPWYRHHRTPRRPVHITAMHAAYRRKTRNRR